MGSKMVKGYKWATFVPLSPILLVNGHQKSEIRWRAWWVIRIGLPKTMTGSFTYAIKPETSNADAT